MRIVIFSDSHNNFFAIRSVVEKHPEADFFIHLGDGYQDYCAIQELYPQKSFFFVAGNCDFGCNEPSIKTLHVENAKILCVHGHIQNIDYQPEPLLRLAKQENCNVVLHGHTHVAHTEYCNGIYLICPGSVSRPRDFKASYAFLDVTEKGIVPVLVPL